MEQHLTVKQIHDNAEIFDSTGKVGTVTGFVTRHGEHRTEVVVAIDGTQDELIVPIGAFDASKSRPDRLMLLAESAPRTNEGETVTVPLAEEQLTVNVRERDHGTIRIRKRTEVVPVNNVIDVRREQVLVEHRQIDQHAESVLAPWHDGETLVVPVYEEILVTEKRLVLREEIRITKETNIEQVPVSEEVRRDTIHFEKLDPEAKS